MVCPVQTIVGGIPSVLKNHWSLMALVLSERRERPPVVFDKFKIKTYSLWDLYLHKNQFPYVGRCYAAAKRENAAKITDMTPEEGAELFNIIIPEWDKSISALFQHDWPNVAILGNDWPHLHAHLIPRYSTPRTVQGIEFVDPNPKGNYSPYPKKELPLELLLQIRDSINKNLHQ